MSFNDLDNSTRTSDLPTSTTASAGTTNNDLPTHQDPSSYPHTIHLSSENIYLELTYNTLNSAAILSQVTSPSAGANVLFLGTTRDTFDNRAVSQLSYTSYAPLALKTLTEIARGAKQSYEGLVAISISHRLGVVPVTESSIAIAVSAAHRGPAWKAGEWILEVCKERLEVWKREEFVGERPEEGEWRANKDTDAQGRRAVGK